MGGAKQFQPTLRKLRRAREQGDVARSKDFIVAMQIVVVFAVVEYSPWILLKLQTYFSRVYDVSGEGFLRVDIAKELFDGAVCVAVICCLPVIGIVACVGLLLEFLQVGVLFSPQMLFPKLGRLSLVNGLKRVCGVEESLGILPLLLRMGKFLTVVLSGMTSAGYLGFYYLSGFFATDCNELVILLKFSASVVGVALVGFSLTLILVGIVDWLAERRKRLRRLMMTIEELKAEHKDSEGDPHAKAMMKILQRDLAQHEALESVRKAKAVITD